MTNTKKRIASFGQVVAVNKALSELISKREDGFVDYLSGHSDETVATAVGVSPTTVRNIRQQLYGRQRPFRLSREGIDPELAAIRDKIHEITDYIEGLDTRLSRLETALT